MSDKMIEKIKNLLKKAESTEFEAERDTYNAHAEQLMIKHQIDAFQLGEYAKSQENLTVVNRELPKNHQKALVTLASHIGNNLDVMILTSRTVIKFAGFKDDVEQAITLYESLKLQAISALNVWWKKQGKYQYYGGTQHEKNIAKRSFLIGFAQGVGQRLERIKENAIREHDAAQSSTGGGSTSVGELILAEKRPQIDEFINKEFPNVGKSKGLISFDPRSGSIGRVEGQNANTGEAGLGKKVDLYL